MEEEVAARRNAGRARRQARACNRSWTRRGRGEAAQRRARLLATLLSADVCVVVLQDGGISGHREPSLEQALVKRFPQVYELAPFTVRWR